MSKVWGPLLSLSARGKFGNTLVFQGRKSGTACYMLKGHGDAKTAKQIAQRTYFSGALAYWRSIGTTYRAVWRDFMW